MGWDAWAVGRDGLELQREYRHPARLLVPQYSEAFKAADARVRQKAKSVDGWLSCGGLDVSASGEYLGRLTGTDVLRDGVGWSPDEVVQYASKARVNQFTVKPDQDDEPFYWSALEFLYTCESLGLGVRFEW